MTVDHKSGKTISTEKTNIVTIVDDPTKLPHGCVIVTSQRHFAVKTITRATMKDGTAADELLKR
jgi:hypothetical protein